MNLTRPRLDAIAAAAAAGVMIAFSGCSNLGSDSRTAAQMLQDKDVHSVARGIVRPAEQRPFPMDSRNRAFATMDDQAEKPRAPDTARGLEELKAR